jgi:predicted Zn-dependent protease with MMP-like domain
LASRSRTLAPSNTIFFSLRSGSSNRTSSILGQLEQDVVHQGGHDGLKAAGPDVLHRVVGAKCHPGDLIDSVCREIERRLLGRYKRLILFGQGVLGLGHDPDEVFLGQRVELDPDWEPSLELGDQVRRLGGVEGARGDEQDVIGADVAVAGLDRRSLDDRQQVLLHPFA